MVYQGYLQNPFWMLLFVCCTVGLNVFDSCMNDEKNCPTGSHCKWLGCDGMRCICKNNLLPSVNKSSCVKETPLGEKCQIGTMCVGQPLSECRLNTLCTCLEGYKRSRNGTYCVLVMKGDDTAAEYGQYCDNEKFWCFPDDLHCSNNKCVCEEGFRPATQEERYAEPYNTRFCRPKSFQLGVPVNVAGIECQKHDYSTSTSTTTTPSTTTSSTATKTTATSPSTTYSTTTKSKTSTTSSGTTTTTTPRTTPSITTTPRTAPSTTTTLSTTSSTTTTTPSTTSSTTTTTPSTTTSTSTTTIKTSSTPTTTPSTTSSTTTPSTTMTTKPSTSSSTTAASTTSPTRTSSTVTTSISTSTTSSTTTATSTRGPSLKTTSQFTFKTATSTPFSSLTTSSLKTSSLATKPPGNFTSTKSSTVLTTTKSSPSTTVTANTTTVGVGEKCHNRKCQENSECVSDACNVERCRCELGYANSPDGKSCWKLSALGEECGGERICQGQKTQCGDKGVCDCQDGYERSDSGRWCRLKSSWFIDFPVVGEECTGSFFSECYMQFEQQCVDGRCRCKEGLREIVDVEDLDAVYPDIVQCRNETYTIGKREEMFCLHQARETHEYDMYDRAKSKIRKIQGAIIGGCVGFVAMLGIVIGVVALVRWKRKGRREMIRDSSSTASTDATSRYSFKIPRPFTHFVGSKDYDSTQIAYPNPVFDKEEERARSEPKPDVVNVETFARDDQNILQNT